MTHPRSPKSAAILLAHGSPQARWSEPAKRVRQALADRRPAMRVELAFLAPAHPDLAEVVAALAHAGHTAITVLPLFLSDGGRHLQEDVPAAIVELRAKHPELTLALVPTALGATPEATTAMAEAADRLLAGAD